MKPIDLLTNIPKSLEINKINSYDAEKAGYFKEQLKQKFEEETLKEQQSAPELSSSGEIEVNKDKNKKNKKNDKNNKEKNKKDLQSKQKKASTSMFDVSI